MALVLVVLLLTGRVALAEDLFVFAAASLSEALQEIAPAYRGRTGDRLRFNLGASNDLARQIKAGAPADVFFSADIARVEELARAGFVRPGERRDVLCNTLAAIVPRDSTLRLERPADPTAVARLALANPEAVPAGVYAKQWLTSVGLWEAVRAHVVPTLDVRAALGAVEAGHVDAGIVYRTDARITPRVRVAFEVPREEGPPIVYALAPIAASEKVGTRPLVHYLAGPDAAVVYERHGFIVLPSK